MLICLSFDLTILFFLKSQLLFVKFEILYKHENLLKPSLSKTLAYTISLFLLACLVVAPKTSQAKIWPQPNQAIAKIWLQPNQATTKIQQSCERAYGLVIGLSSDTIRQGSNPSVAHFFGFFFQKKQGTSGGRSAPSDLRVREVGRLRSSS